MMRRSRTRATYACARCGVSTQVELVGTADARAAEDLAVLLERQHTARCVKGAPRCDDSPPGVVLWCKHPAGHTGVHEDEGGARWRRTGEPHP